MNQFKSEPNRYLTDKVATNHFYDRLQNLITRSVGFVAFRGGMGTVTEISLVWNKLQTRVLDRRPLVLVGDCWRDVVDAGRSISSYRTTMLRFLDFAHDAEDAANIIIEKSKGVVVQHIVDHELSEMQCTVVAGCQVLRSLRIDAAAAAPLRRHLRPQPLRLSRLRDRTVRAELFTSTRTDADKDADTRGRSNIRERSLWRS